MTSGVGVMLMIATVQLQEGLEEFRRPPQTRLKRLGRLLLGPGKVGEGRNAAHSLGSGGDGDRFC